MKNIFTKIKGLQGVSLLAVVLVAVVIAGVALNENMVQASAARTGTYYSAVDEV